MRRTLTALLGLALSVPMATGAATAGTVTPSPDDPEVVADGLFTPLSLAVSKDDKKLWFSQNFAGLLMKSKGGAEPQVVYAAEEGTEVGAVSARGKGATFATTSGDGLTTTLMGISRRGEVSTLADLSGHEEAENPDADTAYGVVGISDECAAEWPVEDFGPATYTGIVESHPYASTSMRGKRYVADAAANAIISVGGHGTVRTVAVLPPQPLTISAEVAEGLELPDCVVGMDYLFEPVPTDVEKGPDGKLYVTTLPGGPEDPSLGARGAVHRVDPRKGKVETVATGLLSATGLAVASNGDMYVAELFGGSIAKIPAGSSTPEPWASVGLPGDVELGTSGLWATTNVLTGLSGEPGDEPMGEVVLFGGQ